MADRTVHQYEREVTISKETFNKFKRKKFKKFQAMNIIAGWYKVNGVTSLHREEGGYTDQLIFSNDNPHFELQGYVFKVTK